MLSASRTLNPFLNLISGVHSIPYSSAIFAPSSCVNLYSPYNLSNLSLGSHHTIDNDPLVVNLFMSRSSAYNLESTVSNSIYVLPKGFGGCSGRSKLVDDSTKLYLLYAQLAFDSGYLLSTNL
jgi:hypothetical protein